MQKFCKGGRGGGRTCPKAEHNLLFLSLCRLLKGKCPCLTQQLGGNLVFKKRRGEGGGGGVCVRGSTGRQCGPPRYIKQNLKHLAK